MNNSNAYEDRTVKEFVQNLRMGQSFLQEPNVEPDYCKNISTGKVYTGINMIIINQAMKDRKKASKLLISQSEIHRNNLFIRQGESAVGTAIFENFGARYNSNDSEVQSGRAKVGDPKKDKNGKNIKPLVYSPVFAAEDVYNSQFVAERDENNEVKRYQQDIYSVTNGQVDRYKKPFQYTDKNNEVHYFNVGDPVILHSKGSVIGSYAPINSTLASNTKSYLPPYIENSDMAPLYVRKDNSGKEILLEKMTEAFRGKLQGNYGGLKIKLSEIDEIEKDFIQHPRLFRNVLHAAQTRAEGNKDIIAKLDADVARNEKMKLKDCMQLDSFFSR